MEKNFNPRPPCGGRQGGPKQGEKHGNFNPRPPCGGRRHTAYNAQCRSQFQSTSSVWRTTVDRAALCERCIFQSTSSVWRTTTQTRPCTARRTISIHVLRVEDDNIFALYGIFSVNFNPRPPCGGRHDEKDFDADYYQFQSTSSVWRTTILSILFNADVYKISIHVLRVEDDDSMPYSDQEAFLFQSTSSVWRTTATVETRQMLKEISIHVLRVEDDFLHTTRHTATQPFQSTSSVWRTTCFRCAIFRLSIFQSTSSVWRTTAVTELFCHIFINFNPRPPCGGRLPQTKRHTPTDAISIHVLRVEDDVSCFFLQRHRYLFQSTSSVWRTTSILCGLPSNIPYFNPRPPCGGRPQVWG